MRVVRKPFCDGMLGRNCPQSIDAIQQVLDTSVSSAASLKVPILFDEPFCTGWCGGRKTVLLWDDEGLEK
jgi:hypothetical protein